jgi:DNA-binding CsgD family transcriptional regulator
VFRGGKYVSPELAERLAFDLDGASARPAHEILSDREYQVLCMIASGDTVTEIATKLCLSAKTISTYRVRLLEKLNMKHNAELARYAIKQGLVDWDREELDSVLIELVQAQQIAQALNELEWAAAAGFEVLPFRGIFHGSEPGKFAHPFVWNVFRFHSGSRIDGFTDHNHVLVFVGLNLFPNRWKVRMGGTIRESSAFPDDYFRTAANATIDAEMSILLPVLWHVAAYLKPLCTPAKIRPSAEQSSFNGLPADPITAIRKKVVGTDL